MFRFANPWFLVLAIPAIIVVERVLRRRWARPVATRFPDLRLVHALVPAGWRWRWRIPVVARGAAILLLCVAAARPQMGNREVEVESQGIDIVLALDVSGSMKAEDFRPRNRLFVAKQVAADFIKGRPQDRIGMVVFAGNAYMQCPLTLDHGILLEFLEQIDFNMMSVDGTAIGMAIASGANRLRDAPGKSRVMVLLTDGQNNAGTIDPVTAAQAAAAVGVRIHTVGVGTRGEALYPVDDPVFGRRYVRLSAEVDDASLTEIAHLTGGEYFRATDPEALAKIFAKIGEMETSRVKTHEYTEYSERAALFLWPALGLLVLELLLADVAWRRTA
jgi:Ca-activated chloride channel homolog